MQLISKKGYFNIAEVLLDLLQIFDEVVSQLMKRF